MTKFIFILINVFAIIGFSTATYDLWTNQTDTMDKIVFTIALVLCNICYLAVTFIVKE